ncbi:MAG: PIG-L family deacetylase [Alphaproteobacteria bacterium]|nr:PIG-L family deacetylase [Alphaproteobacteria bacterium]
MTSEDMLENSIIIAAHPDDELLWFGAVLKKVDRVVMVHQDYWPDPAVGPARAAVLKNYPRDNVMSLKIPEAATHSCADWNKPTLTEFGIELGVQARLRDLKQQVKWLIGKSQAPRGGIAEAYKSNYYALYDGLKDILKPDMNVFTHNPWGEYGHEDHIQVYRVVDRLRREIGFRQWMTNYCTERSLPLAMRYFDNEDREYIQLPVDVLYSEQVADVFRRNGCWTWANNWKWFPFELYTEAPLKEAEAGGQPHILPLNMFRFCD